MVTLDVMVVSTRRPPILALTPASFQNLLGGRFATRGIVNVDSIGGTDVDAERYVDLARSCFDAITVRTPISLRLWQIEIAESVLKSSVERAEA